MYDFYFGPFTTQRFELPSAQGQQQTDYADRTGHRNCAVPFVLAALATSTHPASGYGGETLRGQGFANVIKITNI